MRARGGRIGRVTALAALVLTTAANFGLGALLEPRMDPARPWGPVAFAWSGLSLALLAVDVLVAWLRLHDAGYSVRALPLVIAGWLSGVVTLGIGWFLTNAFLVGLPPDGTNAWGPRPRRWR